MTSRDRQAARWLWAGFFLLYLATAPGGLPRYDAAQMLVSAAAIADHGFAERTDFTRYGVGQSLIDLTVLPWYQLALSAATAVPAGSRPEILTLAGLGMATLPALMAAGLNALVFALSRHLGYAPRPSLLLALAGGLGTMVWIYAGLLFADLTIACLWLLTLLALRLALTRQHHGLILLAGMSAGFALLVKPVAGVALPLFALYLWHGCRISGWSARRALGLFLLPLAAALAVAAWFNWFRFGAPWRTGYEGVRDGFTSPLLLGLYGLLLSSGKGVFFYNPLLVCGVLGAARFWRAHPREAWLIAGLTAALFAVTTPWFGWHGDWAWGPRLLLPLIPLLMLCAAPVAEQVVARTVSPGGRAGLAGLLLLTAFVQGGGLLIEAGDYIVITNTLAGQHWYHPQFWPVRDDCELLHFSPRHSPLIGHWWLVARGLVGPGLLPPWPAVTDATLAQQPAWRLWWLAPAAGHAADSDSTVVRQPAWAWLAAGLLCAGALCCGRRAWQLAAPTCHKH